MKKNPVLKWVFLLVSLFLSSCQEKFLTQDEATSKSNLRLSADKGAIEIDYDVEITRRMEILDYGKTKASKVDVVYTTPTAIRNVAKMKIMHDGSLESEVTEMRPTKYAQMVKHKSLDDNRGKYFKRVTKGNYMEVFDESGKMVTKGEAKTPNMKSILDEVKVAKANSEKNNMKPLNDVVGFGANMVLEMAKAKKGQIKQRSKDIQEVTIDVEDLNSKGVKNFKLVYLLNTAHNTMLTSKLYDKEKGKLLQQSAMMYEIEKTSGRRKINRIYTEDFYDNPENGRKEKITTINEFRKFEFTDNLN